MSIGEVRILDILRSRFDSKGKFSKDPILSATMLQDNTELREDIR